MFTVYWPARATTVINMPVEGGGGLYIDPVLSHYLQQVPGHSIAKVNEIKHQDDVTLLHSVLQMFKCDVGMYFKSIHYTYKINSLRYITLKNNPVVYF